MIDKIIIGINQSYQMCGNGIIMSIIRKGILKKKWSVCIKGHSYITRYPIFIECNFKQEAQ